MKWQAAYRERPGPSLVDRVVRSEPARGPLQLHHFDGKAEIACLRCGKGGGGNPPAVEGF